MRTAQRCTALLCLLLPVALHAREDTLVKKLDSLQKLPPELKRKNRDSIRREFYNQQTKITFGTYFILLGSDLKQQVTAPFHAKPRDWGRTAALTLFTAGVVLADKPISKYAVDLRGRSTAVVETSKYITRFGGPYEVYILAALGT